MKKRLHYFFGRCDEKEVSEALREAFPHLKVIDGQRWPQAKPPIVEGIHACRSRLAYLWPSNVVQDLPAVRLPASKQINGAMFQGPSSGPVIQFSRCNEREGELEVGELSAYFDDGKSKLGSALEAVIAFLKKRYGCRVDCFSSLTGQIINTDLGGYLVGRQLQLNPSGSPRLVLAFGRGEHIIPRR